MSIIKADNTTFDQNIKNEVYKKNKNKVLKEIKNRQFNIQRYYLENSYIFYTRLPFTKERYYVISFDDYTRFYFSFEKYNHFFDFKSKNSMYYEKFIKHLLLYIINILYKNYKLNKTFLINKKDDKYGILPIFKHFKTYEYPEIVTFIETIYNVKYCNIIKNNETEKRFVPLYYYKLAKADYNSVNFDFYYNPQFKEYLPTINYDKIKEYYNNDII
jgi:hypothetical protein